jgi:pimeloyl-ACP methyl ester carboxylesterase
MGALPWAAVGSGPPIVVLAGLSPVTGVAGDGFVRSVLAPVRALAEHRQLLAVNRRAGLPSDLTMSGLAREHADGLRARFGSPVDVVGVSTGGSIAQQLAAEHPDTVRRLVLISSACRLGPTGRAMQAAMASELRAGRVRQAAGVALAGLLPWAGPLARGAGWLAGPKLLGAPDARADLLATLDAEDVFDLATCAGTNEARTLVVAGGRDRFYSPALFTETAELIPRSQLSVIARRGHISVARDRRARAQIAGFLDAVAT